MQKDNKKEKRFMSAIRTLADDIREKGSNQQSKEKLERFIQQKQTKEDEKHLKQEIRNFYKESSLLQNKIKDRNPISAIKNKNVQLTEAELSLRRKRLDSILEEEKLKKDWSEQFIKKQKLKERALKIQNTQNLFQEETREKDLKSIIGIVFVVTFALLGLSILAFGFVGREETPKTNLNKIFNEEVDILTPDIILSLKTSKNMVDWKGYIARSVDDNAKANIITKFVPYRAGLEKRKIQLSLDEFISQFNLPFSPLFRTSLGDYYFLGEYKTVERASNFFMIFSVKDYSSILISALASESAFIDAFINVYPILSNNVNLKIQEKKTHFLNNVNIKELILNNKRSIYYYIFNQNLLIIFLGDLETARILNNKILNKSIDN